MTINQILDPLKESRESRTVHDYIAVDLSKEKDVVEAISAFQQDIPDENIYEAPDDDYGREDELHITVVFGLVPTGKDDHIEDDQYQAIKRFAAKREFEDYTLKFGPVTIFHSKDYDVVVVSVESEVLQWFHKHVVDTYNVDETYPDYKPHMTVAYVKHGTGDQYEGRELPITGKEFPIRDLYYQFSDSAILPIDID